MTKTIGCVGLAGCNGALGVGPFCGTCRDSLGSDEKIEALDGSETESDDVVDGPVADDAVVDGAVPVENTGPGAVEKVAAVE